MSSQFKRLAGTLDWVPERSKSTLSILTCKEYWHKIYKDRDAVLGLWMNSSMWFTGPGLGQCCRPKLFFPCQLSGWCVFWKDMLLFPLFLTVAVTQTQSLRRFTRNIVQHSAHWHRHTFPHVNKTSPYFPWKAIKYWYVHPSNFCKHHATITQWCTLVWLN